MVDRRPHLSDVRPHHAAEVTHITTRVVLIVLLKIQIKKKKYTKTSTTRFQCKSVCCPFCNKVCAKVLSFAH